MTVQTNAGAPQAGAQQGQGEGQAPPQQQAGTGQAPEQQQSDAERLLASITDPEARAYVARQLKDAADARAEAARYRTERNTLQEKVSEAEKAKMTDLERAQTEAREARERAADLERALRERDRGETLAEAVAKAKPFSPKTVAQLIAGQVEWADDGKPTNVDKLLTDLKASDPYLFPRTPSADAGAGGKGAEETPRDTKDMNAQLRAAFGRGR